ncbi:MAG: exonuclease domain-containing protein [bacterium]
MIVVDVEATGTDPYKHGILSVGAVDLVHPEQQFYSECRLREGAHVMEEALKVNGFTMEDISNPTKEGEDILIQAFLNWAQNREEHTMAGQNPSFDRDFLRLATERSKIKWPLAHRTIDVHSVCYTHMKLRGIEPPVLNKRTDLNSTKIQEYVGIPEEPHPHNALNGAKVAAEALSRLLNNKKLLPEFGKYEIPWLK